MFQAGTEGREGRLAAGLGGGVGMLAVWAPMALVLESGAQLSRTPGVRVDLCLLCVSEVGDSFIGGRALSCDETGQPAS